MARRDFPRSLHKYQGGWLRIVAEHVERIREREEREARERERRAAAQEREESARNIDLERFSSTTLH